MKKWKSALTKSETIVGLSIFTFTLETSGGQGFVLNSNTVYFFNTCGQSYKTFLT